MIVNMYVEITCDEKIMWCCCSSLDESLKVDEKIRKRNRIMCRSVCLIVIAIDIEDSEF